MSVRHPKMGSITLIIFCTILLLVVPLIIFSYQILNSFPCSCENASLTNDFLPEKEQLDKTILAILGTSEIQKGISEGDALAIAKVLFRAELKQYVNHERRSETTLPKKMIIFSTWRSGSTFLGDLINSHPLVYYNFEPLISFGTVTVRENSGFLKDEGLRVVESFFECNYTNIPDHVTYAEKTSGQQFKNTRLWRIVNRNIPLRGNVDFITNFCKMYPFHLAKSVRLQLDLVPELMERQSFKVIYLVRDPRGTLKSRKAMGKVCSGKADCADAATLCQNLVENYESAKVLREKYKENFMIIRYEDMSLNPTHAARHIFTFLGLSDTYPSVQEFIKTHTTRKRGDDWGTYRDSKKNAFRWVENYQEIEDLEELKNIQNVCSTTLEVWGYNNFDFHTHGNITEFNPINKPPWSDMVIGSDRERI